MEKKIESYQAHTQTGTLLNANECSNNLNGTLMNEIKDAIEQVSFNRYPDNDQTELLEAYAKVIGVSKDNLLAGNGSDQMLGLMIGTFLSKGKSLYTFDPDFSMYDYYASSYEADIKKFTLNDDGTLDIDAFINEGKKENVDLVMFSNPNNPTGNCLSLEEIKKILNGFKDIPVVVDEAYIEFADEDSSINLIDEYDNLYVTRTLSKAYSLAGLRVGFLVSNIKNMELMKKRAVVYALNSLSMKVATIVLSHSKEFLEEADHTRLRRNTMYEKVKNYKNVYFWKSQANFLHGRSDNKQKLLALFKEKGIVIRDYSGKDTFRITIGTEEENEEVLEVLQEFEEE